jgi:hypothetical protein
VPDPRHVRSAPTAADEAEMVTGRDGGPLRPTMMSAGAMGAHFYTTKTLTDKSRRTSAASQFDHLGLPIIAVLLGIYDGTAP